jgi:hypothetical protein
MVCQEAVGFVDVVEVEVEAIVVGQMLLGI